MGISTVKRPSQISFATQKKSSPQQAGEIVDFYNVIWFVQLFDFPWKVVSKQVSTSSFFIQAGIASFHFSSFSVWLKSRLKTFGEPCTLPWQIYVILSKYLKWVTVNPDFDSFIFRLPCFVFFAVIEKSILIEQLRIYSFLLQTSWYCVVHWALTADH